MATQSDKPAGRWRQVSGSVGLAGRRADCVSGDAMP